eukprot:m.63216 g.63216  ORF g.63216 m.63216 type:complete len:189 (+) comp13959_c0_seq6:249-815(+)
MTEPYWVSQLLVSEDALNDVDLYQLPCQQPSEINCSECEPINSTAVVTPAWVPLLPEVDFSNFMSATELPDAEHSAASPQTPTSCRTSPKPRVKHGKTPKSRSGTRQRRVCDLPPHTLENQRQMARRASQRRRQRVLQQEAELETAMAATDKRRQELEAERRVLAQELKILSDVLVCRHRARQAQPAS